ncbi:hypothetical protein [Morganella morganii]|uniref:hypothetical protein n=1 Tax=Morganella morganii TaxID=582 RepID=UPI00280DCDA8|nr:hypothetical protein [Morganella morganii]
MKSQELRKFESKLKDINDQLCYFLFSDTEINRVFSEIKENTSEFFTTDVFPKNEFSGRLHIKIDALPQFRTKAFHTLVSMSVIASVEYLLNYIEEIEIFRSKVIPSEHDLIKNQKPEEQVKEKLKHWLKKEPENELIKTISYLRLRRNHIAHVEENMNEAFRTLVKNDSNNLNKYWSTHAIKLNSFDFSSTSHSEFKANDIFALINLSRVCMRKIDEMVLSTVHEENIVRYILPTFLSNKKLNGLKLNVKARKFNAFLQQQFGKKMECANSLLKDYLENSSQCKNSYHLSRK